MDINVKYYRFSGLLQRGGWLEPAYVGVDASGVIRYLSRQAPAAAATESVLGFALPGFQNAHSHAFQYAMAGLAENHPAGVDDDFWSWREAMYTCALLMNPDQVEAVAAMLYAEMVRHGYTRVAEFHYLHHDGEGKPYANLAEMGERLIAAAKQAGIGITLIPVFYQTGNFGQPPQSRQRRFISTTLDAYMKLLEASTAAAARAQVLVGASVHSLRAVALDDVKRTFAVVNNQVPLHLHAAEQKKEVADCIAYCGQRPVQWLLNNVPLDHHCNIVHATHLDHEELQKLAGSQANVVLCPSTEGNLGDGIFRMKEYVQNGGRWCIGTDSHIGLNPFEELRMIDYRQRLVTHQRNTFPGQAAQTMIDESVLRGRTAMGLSNHELFAIGQPLDAVVVSSTAHLVANTSVANRLATLLYTSDSARNLGTLVAGKWVVKDQHHIHGHTIKAAFGRAMRQLANR
jgi:formimidoylglutamate deiminase